MINFHLAHRKEARITQFASPTQVINCAPETLANPGGAYHKGLDSVFGTDTPIYATHDGIVSHTITYEDDRSGVWLEISRDGRYSAREKNVNAEQYKHLKMGSICVKKGQAVKKGDRIGTQGATGWLHDANGRKLRRVAEHLHYEVIRAGRVVDPLPYAMGTEKKEEEIEVNLPKLLAANANAPKAFMITCPAHRVKKDAEDELSALRALYPNADIRKDGKWHEIVLGRHEGTIEQARKDVELLRQVTGRQIVLWSW